MNRNQDVVLKPLITEFDLKVRVGNLVREIADDFNGDKLIVIGLLKGSFMFLADMVRLFYVHNIPLLIDFIVASSYGAGTESSGEVNMTRDINTDIRSKWVLLVDDILDTGRTLNLVSRQLLKRKPAVLKTCVLLDKPDRRVIPFQADYVGFTIPDKFVVGYGLDYDSHYRELPYLSVVSFKNRNSES